MKAPEERIGDILAGKYRIDAIIQKGGMGTVFLATHVELGRIVAVKIFHPYLAGIEEATSRFLHEAKGLAKLYHRNIVDVIDIGTVDGHIPFFVMEYLRGESLKDRLAALDTPLSPRQAADIMVQVLAGLHAAHMKGIVHRDLKPGNIFLAKEVDGTEIVKILDFGVAKFKEIESEGERVELTSDGTIIGTPAYMSPEQAMGKREEIDHRSDIYSCGVILYVCLTQFNPFKGENNYETIQNIINMNVPPPSFVTENLPKEIDQVVMKAIEREKRNRYNDCREFIRALEVFYVLDGTPTDGPPTRRILDTMEVAEKLPFKDEAPPSQKRAKRRWEVPGQKTVILRDKVLTAEVSTSKKVAARRKKVIPAIAIACILLFAVSLFSWRYLLPMWTGDTRGAPQLRIIEDTRSNQGGNQEPASLGGVSIVTGKGTTKAETEGEDVSEPLEEPHEEAASHAAPKAKKKKKTEEGPPSKGGRTDSQAGSQTKPETKKPAKIFKEYE